VFKCYGLLVTRVWRLALWKSRRSCPQHAVCVTLRCGSLQMASWACLRAAQTEMEHCIVHRHRVFRDPSATRRHVRHSWCRGVCVVLTPHVRRASCPCPCPLAAAAAACNSHYVGLLYKPWSCRGGPRALDGVAAPPSSPAHRADLLCVCRPVVPRCSSRPDCFSVLCSQLRVWMPTQIRCCVTRGG
jgi:hypothetical protein